MKDFDIILLSDVNLSTSPSLTRMSPKFKAHIYDKYKMHLSYIWTQNYSAINEEGNKNVISSLRWQLNSCTKHIKDNVSVDLINSLKNFGFLSMPTLSMLFFDNNSLYDYLWNLQSGGLYAKREDNPSKNVAMNYCIDNSTSLCPSADIILLFPNKQYDFLPIREDDSNMIIWNNVFNNFLLHCYQKYGYISVSCGAMRSIEFLISQFINPLKLRLDNKFEHNIVVRSNKLRSMSVYYDNIIFSAVKHVKQNKFIIYKEPYKMLEQTLYKHSALQKYRKTKSK